MDHASIPSWRRHREYRTFGLPRILRSSGLHVLPYRAEPFHVSPMSDQVVGAVIMWVLGSLVFLVPAVLITVHLLQRDSRLRA